MSLENSKNAINNDENLELSDMMRNYVEENNEFGTLRVNSKNNSDLSEEIEKYVGLGEGLRDLKRF